MKSNTNPRKQASSARTQRSTFTLFVLFLALIAVVSTSGCVGLTSAGTPASKSSSTSAPAGSLAASSTSLGFGNVTTGANGSQSLTLTNTGAAAILISQATISGGNFTVVGGMTAVSIPAGASHVFQIQFVPQAPGTVTGTMSIVSNAPNSPLVVSLSATAMTTLAISTQPVNQSVTTGQTASFNVAAIGTGALSYQWKKNGAAIAGGTSSSYTTAATVSGDSGSSFTVVVTDSTGSVTSSAASLTVTAAAVAPSIMTAPAAQAVNVGQAASYAVVANGTSPLAYQWKRNGANISGATLASYTTAATLSSDNGANFSVTVSNGAGSVTSGTANLNVNILPSFTTQPASNSVTAGQTATFTAAATGTGTISYQWTKNGSAIGGATSASYTTPVTATSDNGTSFAVIASSSFGNVTSTPATLTVSAAAVAPSIATQPASQAVTAGQTASFSVVANGTATLSYQWTKNGSAISGATSASYTTPVTAGSDNGSNFAVTVTNSMGSVTSSAANLNVNVAPAFTSQPSNQSVTAGQTATFSAIATGTGTLSYQWKKNGTAISGATSASYITPATTTGDNASSFTLTVTSSVGNVTSNAATLTVTAAPVAPSIATQPVNQTVNAGQTATFSVSANGTATLTYQWTKNGAPISGATSASYTTPATSSLDNSASFVVTVTNAQGNVTSSGAMLTVNVPPAFTTQPSNQTVNAGQTATFTVAATGTGTVNYQWKKNGTAISGATAASYTTPATSGSDNGSSFTVTATDSITNITSNAATLTVNSAPAISTQPTNQTVTTGQTATFNVAATGTGTLSYQWSKNGSAISGATSASYTTPVTASSDSGASFTVTVTNTVGNVTSNTVTLTVNVAPAITTQPVNQTVTSGQTATFTVVANGTGTLTYQWKKNGTVINGATSASYTTPATAASDNASSFTVTVSNSVSNVTSNAATLTVNVAPSMTTQPVSQTVTSGQAATFTAAATGTGTLSYQWNKNGVAINGAMSASYTTPATSSSDNNTQFSVIVTNSVGNVTSSTATLTVTTSTMLLNASTNSLSFGSVNTGSNSVLSVTFTNAGNANVTVSGVSISGAGYTAGGISTGQIIAPNQTATLNVTFAPSSTGTLTGSVTVSSNATNSTGAISLTGTGAQQASHSVTLSWTASTSTVNGYNVYQSTVSGGPYTQLDSSMVTNTAYTDSTVQSGHSYYYVVTSINPSGVESGFSSKVSANIP